MERHHLRSGAGPGTVLEVSPESAGWGSLHFSVLVLEAGTSTVLGSDGREIALVPLEGDVEVRVDGTTHRLSRASVFTEMPHVLYVPPGHEVHLAAGPETRGATALDRASLPATPFQSASTLPPLMGTKLFVGSDLFGNRSERSVLLELELALPLEPVTPAR